jgi:hypothetical protein
MTLWRRAINGRMTANRFEEQVVRVKRVWEVNIVFRAATKTHELGVDVLCARCGRYTNLLFSPSWRLYLGIFSSFFSCGSFCFFAF